MVGPNDAVVFGTRNRRRTVARKCVRMGSWKVNGKITINTTVQNGHCFRRVYDGNPSKNPPFAPGIFASWPLACPGTGRLMHSGAFAALARPSPTPAARRPAIRAVAYSRPPPTGGTAQVPRPKNRCKSPSLELVQICFQ